MYIELQNLNLYTGIREEDYKVSKLHLNDGWIKMGNCNIRKNGDSILTEECNFKLQVEQNLQSDISHNGTYVCRTFQYIIIFYFNIVPDMSIHGELSTLDLTLNESQYKLIRGLFAHNLSKSTENMWQSMSWKQSAKVSVCSKRITLYA